MIEQRPASIACDEISLSGIERRRVLEELGSYATRVPRLALIGRSEQTDTVQGISSNYSCQSCCTDGFLFGEVSPAGVRTVTLKAACFRPNLEMPVQTGLSVLISNPLRVSFQNQPSALTPRQAFAGN
jgi:hypothetical protein